MKLSTLILASLMPLTSIAAFAEGGSERSKEYYNNFTFIQEKTHGPTEKIASALTKKTGSDSVDNNGTSQQPES
ncbi:hypothetical protein GIR22_20870 [Pseudomonas sp. CCM 7891]|uniref:Uncharacterized protein n=1 Tax=Pseudomonas karstica TaxID=1055468 RepID=A0A7X2RWZ9_9PSED|nr:hypothetical protein [Pseudomonas karstica]MTD21580.1 hypothetical protein [Pseudomonas karstica]